MKIEWKDELGRPGMYIDGNPVAALTGMSLSKGIQWQSVVVFKTPFSYWSGTVFVGSKDGESEAKCKAWAEKFFMDQHQAKRLELHQRFAMAALTGYTSRPPEDGDTYEGLADDAIVQADTMMTAYDKCQEEGVPF